jgi:hypothetical protein
VETAFDALALLTQRYAFGEVAALLGAGAGGERLTNRDVAQVQQLCAFGQRLIDLDAEDFGELDSAAGANVEHEVASRFNGEAVPEYLRERALACRVPQSPREKSRGALGTLKPTYRLLLEVIDARFRRHETNAVVAAVHIASEYAPLLAWEHVLGHAADPIRMPNAVGGEGSVWGDFDDRECPHTKTEKSAARRALTVAQENDPGWRTYLARQHSNVSHAFGVCAAECRRPCSVYTRLSTAEAAIVTHGCRLAMVLNDSAIMRLRHSAPVGHGFGVPSPDQLLETWGRTRTSLGRIDPSVLDDDGFALPGFAALVSALAHESLVPDTLLADTGSEITGVLGEGAKARA